LELDTTGTGDAAQDGDAGGRAGMSDEMREVFDMLAEADGGERKQ
jgi:hypothetical protein